MNSRAEPGEWIKLKSEYDFSPSVRYGHTAVIYEPATSDALARIQNNLRLAVFNSYVTQDEQNEPNGDTAYMIVFGGKNAQIDVLFNDIYFLGIP